FFQAEDGIRDRNVTGVQTCALPISNLKDYVKQSDIENFITEQDVQTLIDESIPDVSNFITEEDVPDVSNFITEEDVPDVSNFVTVSEVQTMIDDALKGD